MQRLIWIVAGIGFVVWSLLAWFGYAVLGWVGEFTANNAGQFGANTELADWLAWAAGTIGAAGGTLIVIVWLFGAAVIAAVAFGIAKLVQRREAPPADMRAHRLPPGHR